MTRFLPLATVTALGVALLVPAALMSVPSAAGAAPPVHTVALTTTSGSLPSWPAYDASVRRFAIAPSADNDGTATVTAQTSDPAGRVRVNGQVVPNGQAVPIQLESGHELSVIIDDAAGHSAQSWIELPPGSPVNHATSTGTLHQDAGDADADLLTLSNFVARRPRRRRRRQRSPG